MSDLLSSWEATARTYQDLLNKQRDMARQRNDLQNELSLLMKGDRRRVAMIARLAEVDAAKGRLSVAVAEARIRHEMFDMQARFAKSGGPNAQALVTAPVETTLPAPKPEPVLRPPNEAEMKHLNALVVRVRDDDLKMRARLDAAHEFIAVSMAILRGKS